MNYRSSLPLLVAALLPFTPSAHAGDTPYAGQESRAIKALSESEINDYLNGRGMGTSKAAELNHYPGPKHVLDQATQLGMSGAQSAQARVIFDAMTLEAKRLGKEIVQKEEALEALYAKRQATAENTRQAVAVLAQLQAEFRLAHLNAHLRMREVLSPQQIALYDQLRGYAKNAPNGAAHQHH